MVFAYNFIVETERGEKTLSRTGKERGERIIISLPVQEDCNLQNHTSYVCCEEQPVDHDSKNKNQVQKKLKESVFDRTKKNTEVC